MDEKIFCLFMLLLCAFFTVMACLSDATGTAAGMGIATGLWCGNLINESRRK